MIDYVGEMTPHAKFHVNLHKGASRQMGEIYAKIFVARYLFLETHLQVRPFGGFLRAKAQTTQSRARMCLLGIKNLKLILNVFIRKNQKNYNGAYREN